MNNIIKDFLLIESLQISSLMEDYHLFFLKILPSVFMLAVVIEYFGNLEPLSLVKRAFVSVIILVSVGSFYHSSIELSMDAANTVLKKQQGENILLKEMLDGTKQWKKLQFGNADRDKNRDFFKTRGFMGIFFTFFKHHLFESFINDSFMLSILFISKICFFILKIVYSLVYYLGFGLIGIPCLLYIFPSMGSVLRGGVISYLWLLIVPHIFVFIVALLASEINKGYITGQVIGGSVSGTALLFVLAIFIAFVPLIASMILTGSGVSAAGGVIAAMGANWVMNMPRKSVKMARSLFKTGRSTFPGSKMQNRSKSKQMAYTVMSGGGSSGGYGKKKNGPRGTGVMMTGGSTGYSPPTPKDHAGKTNPSTPSKKAMGIEGGDGRNGGSGGGHGVRDSGGNSDSPRRKVRVNYNRPNKIKKNPSPAPKRPGPKRRKK